MKLSRNRESANVQVLYFVGSVQKCGAKFSTCCAYWWQKKRKSNSSSLVVSYFLWKQKRKTKNLLNCPVCVLEISDLLLPCILQGTHNNNSVVIQFYHFSNHVSCQIPVGKTTKMSFSKKVILQMYSIYFSFEDMTLVKIWRDEIKQLKICCLLRHSSKTASCLKLHWKSDT